MYDSDEESSTTNSTHPSTKPQPSIATPTVGVASDVPMETDTPRPRRAEPEGPKEQRTVFVSNLPEEVTKPQLREKFSEVGLER